MRSVCFTGAAMAFISSSAFALGDIHGVTQASALTDLRRASLVSRLPCRSISTRRSQ